MSAPRSPSEWIATHDCQVRHQEIVRLPCIDDADARLMRYRSNLQASDASRRRMRACVDAFRACRIRFELVSIDADAWTQTRVAETNRCADASLFRRTEATAGSMRAHRVVASARCANERFIFSAQGCRNDDVPVGPEAAAPLARRCARQARETYA